jgi:tetratricopeptide (TPR) repeat protein
MLETIREFGSEQLVAHHEAAAIGQQHTAYYLALAEEAAAALDGPEAIAWLARLDTEHDNLRAALRWALDRGDRVTALRLAGALWRFWAQRGHLSEGRRWFSEAFALPGDAGPATPAAQVNWLVGAARLAMDQAAFDEAAAYCAQAAALTREHGNARDQAAALNTQGLLARAQNLYADAAQAHQAALPLARAAADRSGAAAALLGLAYAAMFTGDAMRAASLAEESLAEARESGDQPILAQVLFFLSWVASNGAGFERAGVLVTEALSLFSKLGDTSGCAEALFVLGTVEVYSGRYQEAAGFLGERVQVRPRTRMIMLWLVAGFHSPIFPEGRVGGTQQPGQGLAPHGDVDRGQLVQEGAARCRRRASQQDLTLHGEVRLKAIGERRADPVRPVGRGRAVAADCVQVGQQILPLPSPPGEDGERIVVEGLGQQVEDRRDVLARDFPVRAGAVHRKLAGRGGEQRQTLGREHLLDAGGHLPGQQLGAVPGAARERPFQPGPLGLAERADADAHPVGPLPAALDPRRHHPRVHVERDHLASARVVPAPLQPVAQADALQDLDEPAGPPGLADRPARAAGLQPAGDGPWARRRRVPATHRPRPPTARTPSAAHAWTVR